MLNKLLAQKEVLDKPPVLIDIGASGKINNSWKKLTKYAICIACDADQRDFPTEIENAGYKN